MQQRLTVKMIFRRYRTQGCYLQTVVSGMMHYIALIAWSNYLPIIPTSWINKPMCWRIVDGFSGHLEVAPGNWTPR